VEYPKIAVIQTKHFRLWPVPRQPTRGLFFINSKQATAKFKLGHKGLKQASTQRPIGTHRDLGTDSGIWRVRIRVGFTEADIATAQGYAERSAAARTDAP
jgi:hypothetical protein